MGKSYDKLNRWEQRNKDRMMAKEMGIDVSKYQEADRGSEGSYDWGALRDEMRRRDNSNYNTRRSIEAAKLAGYEGADALPNHASNMEEFYQTREFMQGIHENSLGNTGKYSYGGDDAAGVTKYLVEQDRSNFKDSMTDLLTPKDGGDGSKAKEPEKPYVPSERMQQANDFVKQYELKLRDPGFNPFATGAAASKGSQTTFDTRADELGMERSAVKGGNELVDTLNTSPLDNTSVKIDAQDFKDKYSFKVKDAMKKNGVKTSNFGITLGLG